jgi:hypothetical protein
MKNFLLIVFLTGSFILLSVFPSFAQDSTKTEKNEKKEQSIKHQQHFIDEDGDGYNDNAPDHDGDGIPNGLDPDWQKFKKERKRKHRFVDLDGDGINDNIYLNGESKNQGEENLNSQQEGSSLEKKTKEQEQKQQKKQRGKP